MVPGGQHGCLGGGPGQRLPSWGGRMGGGLPPRLWRQEDPAGKGWGCARQLALQWPRGP